MVLPSSLINERHCAKTLLLACERPYPDPKPTVMQHSRLECRRFDSGRIYISSLNEASSVETRGGLPRSRPSSDAFSYRRVTRRFTRQLAQSTQCTQTIPRVALIRIGFLPLRIWVDDTVTGPSGFCFVGSME